MLALTLVPSPAHTRDDHPENHGRFAHFDRLGSLPFAHQLLRLTPTPASVAQIATVHTYAESLRAAMAQAPAIINYAGRILRSRRAVLIHS